MSVRHWLTLVAAGLILAGCIHSAPDAAHSGKSERRNSNSAAHPIAGLAPVLAGLRHPAKSPAYYLSLGDSLAQGIQPGPTGADGPTVDGYPNQLEAMLRTRIPGLRRGKLGCSGETTETMIRGGICGYPAGSQLAQAVRFLRAHRGQVALVTIDIGANDPNTCVLGQPVSQVFGCLSGRITQTERNIVTIMARLRAAAGRRVLIVGMTYYVPELGLWRTGPTGRQIALLTEGFAAGVNQLLAARYRRYGARVANVFGAFRSADFAGLARASHQIASSIIPPNVMKICSLTWMCAARPRGPNEHANDAGYRVIARTFWHAIIG
jgi:lysophospholipase L1-like esterase